MGADNGRAAKYDRGFTLSDHADWPSLLRTIEETGARRVLAMHGDTALLVRTLRVRGTDAVDMGVAWRDRGAPTPKRQRPAVAGHVCVDAQRDRMSVVERTRVAVRVNIGGGRSNK